MMTTFEMTDRGMTDMAAAIGRPGWHSYAGFRPLYERANWLWRA